MRNDRTISLMILEYLNICRQEQRLLDNLIRETNTNSERTYNLIIRYLDLQSIPAITFPMIRRAATLISTEANRTTRIPPPPPSTPAPSLLSTLLPPPHPQTPAPSTPRLRRTLREPLTQTNIRIMTQVFQYSDLSSNQALCAITRENFTEDDSVLKIIFFNLHSSF